MNTPVSFELAKLLKEKDFDVTTKMYYEHSLTESYNEEDGYHGPFGWKKGETNLQSGYHINNSEFDSSNEAWFLCSAPTVAEVVMWLYEKQGVWVVVDYYDNGDEYIWFYNYKTKNKESMDEGFNSPTEAYEAAIKYALQNLI